MGLLFEKIIKNIWTGVICLYLITAFLIVTKLIFDFFNDRFGEIVGFLALIFSVNIPVFIAMKITNILKNKKEEYDQTVYKLISEIDMERFKFKRFKETHTCTKKLNNTNK